MITRRTRSPHISRYGGSDAGSPPQLPCQAKDTDDRESCHGQNGREGSGDREHKQRCRGGDQPVDSELMVITPPGRQ